jgi:hypothetical protein
MNIKIVTIADRGVPNKERIQLLALGNVNLVYYALFDTETASPTTVVTIPKRAYWFNSYEVKAGDNIVLYTGAGHQSSYQRPDGGKNHFFYWARQYGLEQS